MNPWLETFSVILVASAGVLLGRRASVLPDPLWFYLLLAPVVMLGLLIVSACTSLLDCVPSLLFITAGRARYVVLSLAITFGLTVPLSRLPCRMERLAVFAVMMLFVALFSVVPFLVPALIRDNLSRLPTRIDGNGICYQSRSYTCGPAAAVTALTRCGFAAREGEIAVLARTNPVSGTLLWTLYSAIKNRYAPQGLTCRFRRFDNIGELRDAGITLVSLREAALLDHCVAVLAVSDTAVTVADPAVGLEVLPLQAFEAVWRHYGIVIDKKSELTRL